MIEVAAAAPPKRQRREEARGGPRIRLLMVISDLTGGGAERQFSLLLRHLPRRDFEIHACFWRPVFRYDLPDDVTVHMVEKTRPWHVFPAIRGMRRLIDEVKPDLVYTQLHYINMVTGTALAMKGHRPRWVCRQVNDPRREMPHLFGVWARWSLRGIDRAVGCSEGVRQEVVRYLRVPAERTVRLDNLVDVEAIRDAAAAPVPAAKTPDTFTVVHAGRLHAQKNQRLLLDAFARLKGRAELWMLGEGPLEGELRSRAEQLGIASRIRWLGFQDNPFAFFRAADCVALSSDWEGLPNVVIEAMVCGTPVVSTRCPFGPEELIDDGQNGLLVPTGDAVAFAEALQHLADHPEERRRMGELARQAMVRRFSVEPFGAAFADLFKDTLVRDTLSSVGHAAAL